MSISEQLPTTDENTRKEMESHVTKGVPVGFVVRGSNLVARLMFQSEGYDYLWYDDDLRIHDDEDEPLV
ncbi:MAG: hypothetical protein ACLFS6_06560 [Methanomassiliicoccales archaeon]